MDNLTHTLVGLMMSRAGLNRFHVRASAILILAANVPDIDAVSVVGGAGTYFHYHRGITHAIAFAPVMALLPVLAVRIISRKPLAWLSGYLLALAGVASHLLLDFTNMYGIRLYLPFSNAWPNLAITSVIDPWIWAVLVLVFVGPLISRLVSSEIGGKSATGRGGAIFALLFLSLYDGGRAVLHQRAVAVQDARMYNGETPRRVAALPSLANPMRWEGIVETDSAFFVHPVDLAGEFDPSAGRVFYKTEETAETRAARATQVFQDLTAFAPFVFWQVTPSPEAENAVQVEAADLRFGTPPDPRFVATAIVQGGRVLRSWFRF
ncbi:MAG: metal-dependent hydrolase [Bryobacteraceae bacterium]